MATRERDYYEVLGVPRDAGDADIKRAFRKLARELHPDVSSAPEADKDFREVAEAFEVLSDPERRATYDRFGHAGLRRGGFHPTFTDFGNIADVFTAFFGEDLFGAGVRDRGPARGGDIQVALEIELEDAFTGVTVPLSVDVAAQCETCGGAGLVLEPHDSQGMADAIVRAATDEDTRGALVSAGLERAAAFSWDRSAQLTDAAISEVLSDGC